VGSNLSLFVVAHPKHWTNERLKHRRFLAYFNPSIIKASEETIEAWEGCLSNDEFFCLVERPKQVEVRFQDERGKEKQVKLDGAMSRVVQHEIAHLEGEPMEERALRKQSIGELERKEELERFFRENEGKILV